MSTALAHMPMSDMSALSVAIAKSGLFGIKTPDQALALMAIAQAEGRHPGIVARDYHIIQGRPALKADAMLARFLEAGGRVEWHQLSGTLAEATFAHPAGGTVRLAWSIDDAKRAGLTKNPTWGQYPRAMLRARLVSEGIRTVCPGVVVGTYTPEEVADMAPPMRDMGQAERIDTAAPIPQSAPSGAPQPARQPVAPIITEAQHKRLEARIAELGLDRERVKAWVRRAWGAEHLNEVPAAHYQALDDRLDLWADAQRETAAEREAIQAESAPHPEEFA